jgi:hypothetical protein
VDFHRSHPEGGRQELSLSPRPAIERGLLLYVEQHKGGELLILDLFRKPKVTVEHSDAGIIVTMPGTGFSVIYVRAGDNKLVASGFSSAKRLSEKHKVSFPQFLALAWMAANAKARELGWIA